MGTEPCELRGRGGATSVGTAETVRYGAGFRWARSGGITAVGLVIGLALTPVPGLHLVAPWLIPLGCGSVGLYLLGVKLRLDAIRGPCPTCGQPVEARNLGQVRNEEIWIRCGHCGGPVIAVVTA